YDRKLTDILGVESEIAKGIAESLEVKLIGREERALAVKPTNNADAYVAYLRGLSFEARNYSSYYSPDLLQKAAGFFERAVQLDPNFAIAWERLCRADAHLYFATGPEAAVARRDAAKRALENAQSLEPNLPETLLALGYYQYWVLRDYGTSKITFNRVGKILPSSSEVPYALALITRREGSWDQSAAYFEQALALDPRNVELLMDSAETYAELRKFPAALKLYDRALDITPNDPDVMSSKAGIYQTQGKLQEAAKLLSEINEQPLSGVTFARKITQLQLERDYAEAIRLVRTRLAQFHFDSEYDKACNQVSLAFAQRFAGDTTGAKVAAESARNILEPVYRDQSRSPAARAAAAAQLSQAHAVMGLKVSALEAAEHAIKLLPRAKDSLLGPSYEENLALIQTIFGENSRAISTLTLLLQIPYAGAITPALLRFDPLWDPLRGDPDFQKLCEEKQPAALK